MKTAIYIEDDVTQLVMTPETDFEVDALDKFCRVPLEAEIKVGGFYDCNGGWIRHQAAPNPVAESFGPNKHEQSLIIKIDNKPKEVKSE